MRPPSRSPPSSSRMSRCRSRHAADRPAIPPPTITTSRIRDLPRPADDEALLEGVGRIEDELIEGRDPRAPGDAGDDGVVVADGRRAHDVRVEPRTDRGLVAEGPPRREVAARLQ